MDVEDPVKDLVHEMNEEEEDEDKSSQSRLKSQKNAAGEHKDQLERLKEKDPEFYQFLQENEKELLEFNDEDIEEDVDTYLEDVEMQLDERTNGNHVAEMEYKPPKNVITAEMVESWCISVQEHGKIGSLRSLLKAFRIACHYGDDGGDESTLKLNIMSSSVFNKIMLFVLNKMDGILRNLMGLPPSGGKRELVNELKSTRKWKNYSHLVKSYFGNALHILNQMTDTEMISFTLRRLKFSSVFLAAFPSLFRKYIKVLLHFWGTGGGALPVVSFLFLRDLCIRLGSDCLDECFKGIYKAYVLSCQFINAVKLQHIQFLGNCVIELIGVDLPTAYQHAFVYIRQLAMILRNAITMKTKESFRKVYEWKFMNCLELWTGAVCVYGAEADFNPLAYPLTQIISGVIRLVPTARYFPLRLRCVRMLNQIAASTGTFIPVSMLLLDMLEMKELNMPPTGGVGKAIDMRTILKVSKPKLKTRAFQEACVFSVVEELAEHLAQWSYSIAFLELSFIPAVRLRSFCKTTKVERFRKEMRQLIRQIESNSKFTNERRMSITYTPNDPTAASFLEKEKNAGTSPLSQYVRTLHQRAQQRNDALMESSVLVGEHSSVFCGDKIPERSEVDDGDEKGAAVFSSSWLPSGSKATPLKDDKKKKKKNRKLKHQEEREEGASDEDVVEDLVLSSEEDGIMSDSSSTGEDENIKSGTSALKREKQKVPAKFSKSKMKSLVGHSPSEGEAKPVPPKQQGKNSKPATILSNKNVKSHARKSRKRKRTS